VRHRRGFTLVELLIVMLIIGVLASIAILKFGGVKEKAYLATMRSDLRNLVTAQEAYHGTYGSYANDAVGIGFAPSAGVVLTIGTADTMGWNAVATHNATSRTCGIFMGTAASPVAGAVAGMAMCP
jgi:prepilin-type N-terminal cleavage/methylation domain-containing protein